MLKNDRLTFLDGVKDALPIALGYFSVSFAFGMLAIEKGLPLWAPMLTSLTNFTGTGQFAGVGLMATGAMFTEIAFTIFIINIRYILMSISLSQKLPAGITFWQRLIIAFGNTDEIFAVSIRKQQPLNFRYLLGLIFFSYFGWNLGTVAGVFASAALPESVMSALGIALFAMFIAIIIPPARESKPVAIILLIAVALSCLLNFVPFLKGLGSGWNIILCGVVSAAVGALCFPVKEEEEAQTPPTEGGHEDA